MVTEARPNFKVIGTRPVRPDGVDKVTGRAQYGADVQVPGALYARMVRSPHAHATLGTIDVSAARAVPGVVAVFTAADTAGRTEPICVAGEVHTPERLLRELKPLDRLHPIPLFPTTKVTYVGQPVALIVAESRHAAVDAAEQIQIEYEPLPAVLDPVAALAPGAALVEPSWESNLALSVATGKGAPEEAFASAPVVVEEEIRTHRYAASPLEPRGILATVEPFGGALTVWAGTQTPHVLQTILAGSLREPVERMRVKSIITAPRDNAKCARLVHVSGWAWSGDGGITRVDLGVDGGDAWIAATLGPPASSFAWTPWSSRASIRPRSTTPSSASRSSSR